MTKHTVTEEEVILTYREQVKHISLSYKNTLDCEDANMEGLLGLLIAIRGFRKSYTDFPSYMKQCTIRQLDSAKRAHQSECRAESGISLDQDYADSTTAYKDLLPARLDASEDSCMLREFIAGLPEALRTVFWRRYFGYSDHEIAVALSISDQELSQKITDLQFAWHNYCGDIT